MALNRSHVFKGVTVPTVCVETIQFESAWALTNMNSCTTCRAKLHASEASGSEEDFNIFLCVSMVQTQNILGRIHFGLWGHYLNKLD